MSDKEKLYIFMWVLTLLVLLVIIPNPTLPVSKSCCSADTCAKEHHHE